MIDFIQQQLEASDRMFKVMFEDHKERMDGLKMWMEVNTSLIKKLEERDQLIEELRAKLKQYETTEVL